MKNSNPVIYILWLPEITVKHYLFQMSVQYYGDYLREKNKPSIKEENTPIGICG